MAKAIIKTSENEASVSDYLDKLKDEQQKKDAYTILELMKKASKEKPKMWGASLIGFGNVVITSPTSGRTVDWFRIGFAPRKGNFSLYLNHKVLHHAPTLKKLGKHKTGMGCLYFNKLADVDVNVLKGMIEDTLKKK